MAKLKIAPIAMETISKFSVHELYTQKEIPFDFWTRQALLTVNTDPIRLVSATRHMEQLWGQPGKTQPGAAIPRRLRRIRHVSVNIESNGGRRCRCPKYPKAPIYLEDLLNPWAMDKYQQMQYHMVPPDYAYALNCSSASELPHDPSGPIQANANVGQQSGIEQLELIMDSLLCQQQADANCWGSYNSQPQAALRPPATEMSSTGCENPTANNTQPRQIDTQLNLLTGLVRSTMLKLDNYLAAQKQQQIQSAPASRNGSVFDLAKYLESSLETGPVSKHKQGKTRGKLSRVVKVMPVQPLVFMAPPAAVAPPTPPVPATRGPTKYRQRLRKKRSPTANPKNYKPTVDGPTANATSSSSKTDSPAAPALNTHDRGTTVWCPRDCGGMISNGASASLNAFPAAEQQASGSVPIPIQLFAMGQPPPVSQLYAWNTQDLPCRQQDNGSDVSLNHTCKLDRKHGGKLTNSYIVDEQEQRQQSELDTDTEGEIEQNSWDAWYDTASISLARLEKQESYFSDMPSELLPMPAFDDKLLQTDSCCTIDNSTEYCLPPTNFITTSDKAVSTADMLEEAATARKPTKIVRVYKTSALKPRRFKKSSKKHTRVKFAKLRTEQSQVDVEPSAKSTRKSVSFQPPSETLINASRASISCLRSHSNLRSSVYPTHWSQ